MGAPALASVVPSMSEQPTDVWALLKAVTETAALFGFLLTVIGWSYLAAYYSFFTFQPMELDISSSVVFLFAVDALSRLLIPLIVIIAIILVLHLGRVKLPRLGGIGLLLILTLSTLGLHDLGSLLGRRSARLDIWNTSSRLPSVGLYLRSSREGYPSCASATNPTIDCRLLLHNKGSYYLIKPFDSAAVEEPEAGTATIKNLEVYAVPDSEVQLVQYERGVR